MLRFHSDVTKILILKIGLQIDSSFDSKYISENQNIFKQKSNLLLHKK